MFLWLLACTPDPDGPGMLFELDGDFWASPFPGNQRLGETVALSGFPNPDAMPVIDDLVSLLDGVATGFGTTSPIYLPFDGALPATGWPGLEASMSSDSPVWLVDVDSDSPEQGRLFPLDVVVMSDGGPVGPSHALAVLPVQGVPLRPATTYALAVSQQLEGTLLQPLPEAVRDLWPEVLPDEELAALTVFTTWDPLVEQTALSEAVEGRLEASVQEPWALTEVFDETCVYESTVTVPVFQQGEPPYLDGGGGISFEDGEPVFDHDETARILVTMPRSEMSADGFPVVVHIRTGAGGDRALVERGQQDADGVLLEPGSGYGRVYGAAGFAGVSVDGPLGGLRNTTGGDEQFLIFNVSNPVAMRDNLRQSAAELAGLPGLLDVLEIDASECPGLEQQVAFDTGLLGLFGHSMGATIAPVALHDAPEFTVALLSGAGGSWIENIVYKQSPLEVRPLAAAMFGYASTGFDLTEHDPILALLQWAGEGADPPVADRVLRETDLDVLKLQGIVDTYILPPIANPTSLSMGLDLVGPSLDVSHPDLVDFDPLEELLPLVDADRHDLPWTASSPLRAVVQYPEDGLQDGHEVAFQTEAPQRAVRCVLEALAEGEAPVIPEGGSWDEACE